MIRAFKTGAGWAFRRGRLLLVPYRTQTPARRLVWRVFYRSGGSIYFGKFETAWASFVMAKVK